VNLEQLRAIARKEREKDSLQALREGFYQDVAAYLDELRSRREVAAADAPDPFDDPTVSRVSDEIETAREIVTAVYERRTGKLVKQASFHAAGMTGAVEGLTAEEQTLFDDLVERMRAHHAAITATIETPETGHATEAAASDPSETSPPTAETERMTLRITADVGPILGVDEREYDLRRDDLVTLPTPNAQPLLERDAAEEID
jgi:DNA replication factor GINS